MLHHRLACTLLTGAALFAGTVAWSQDPPDNGRADPDRPTVRRPNRFQRSDRGSADRPQRGGFGGRGPSFERIAERFDENSDGKITKDEFAGPEEMFTRMDRNEDGVINADDFRGGEGFGPPGGGFGRGGGGFGGRGGGFGRGGGAARMFGVLDSNGDDKITLDDLQAFLRKADTDGDEALTVEELEKAIGGGGRGGRGGRFGRGGGGGFGGFQNFPTAKPASGETAPAFELKDLGGKTVALADLLKTRPVVVEFGSFT